MILSIIIATYEMQREAPRTIRSALPPLQANNGKLDYEICILDNGSPNGPACLEGIDFGDVLLREFHIPRNHASPSPISAINQIIEQEVTSRFVMVCIDGARMFSKQLVRRSLQTVSSIPHSIAFVQTRHLGNEIQSKAVENGYCQSEEDALLAESGWEQDLDALFEISILGGCHNKDRPLIQNESGALTLSRADWLALGGYNDKFARPGGGLGNIELFGRITDDPDYIPILLAGEATFHQFHGGAATSNKHYASQSFDEYEHATGKKYERQINKYLVDFDTDPKRLDISGIRF